ncbi:ubiquitin-conjugating enzyme domain-containing protein [Phthorimaea operculella]|nr:ubiquitin-conjugating enzyme domain-containing protein [Phthorimaea operculella]
MLQPSEPRSFYSAVKREIKLLKSDLPPGVWVRGFEDRIDLLSVMIAGPANTPYEDGLFVFDVQLGGEYPRAPPLCHYHSYCSDRLNPNLYEDGKVCVSLLGTWSGRGVEVWGKDSSLLQVIVSLQGLILNAEPYFNEAGYEKQKGTQQGTENSRMYNEMVLLKLVQSMTRMTCNPPEPFRKEILAHMRAHAHTLCKRLEGLAALSAGKETDVPPPDYPLVPASRGFCLTLRSSLDAFRAALRRNDIPIPDPAPVVEPTSVVDPTPATATPTETPPLNL